MNPRSRSFGSTHLALLVFSLLVINPVIIYLLLDGILATVVLTVTALVALQACYIRYGSRLPTVYLVNVLTLGGIFSYAELLVRFRFADYVMEDLYRIRGNFYWNRAGLQSRLTDKEFSVDYLTNKDGFRIGYSQQVEVTHDKIDWLFLGDSYTQGAQVDFEDLYTTHLYRRFPDRIVANAGISGWGIPEEYYYFQQVGRKYEPEIVFLQVSNFNDFMKVAPRTAGVSDRLMQHSHFVRLLLQDIKYENPARLPLGRWAEPFYPDHEANRRFNIFYTPTDNAKEQDLRSYRDYLGRLAASVQESGARLVIILLPTKEQIRFSFLQEVVTEFGIDPQDLDLQRPNTFMRQLADSFDVELIDVLDAFTDAEEEPYFDFDEHLTPAGHRLLAEIIAQHMEAGNRAPAPQILSLDYAGDRYPSYAPDGQSLVFQSVANGNMELFWTDRDFSYPHRLTFNDVDESHPTIAPQGDRLAFTEGDAAVGNTNVVIADLSARVRETVTAGPQEFGAIPSFSQDGQYLAYAGWSVDGRTGSYTTPRIIVADLWNGDKQALTDGQSEAWRPVFSPDGRSIAYISKVGEQFDIFRRDLSSGEVRRLTETPYDEWDPQFSPDGKELVYAAKADANWDLFLLSLVTGENRQITRTRGDEWDPVFSQDESSITYGGEYGIFRGVYRLRIPG